MRFVPVKSAEQQAILSLHRVRQGFIEQRTATINRIRGLLTEFGVVLPQRADQVRRAAVVVAEGLPVLARAAITDLRAHLAYLDERINRYERQLVTLAKQRERRYGFSTARRRATHGLGDHGQHQRRARIRQRSAVCSVAGISAATIFDRRQATLGPHHEAGRCLPATLLMLGPARYCRGRAETDRWSRWAMALRARRGYHRAIIAVAAKNARIIWALLANNRAFALPV